MNCNLDTHILILFFIMLAAGMLGGYVNYLHNFDKTEVELKSKTILKSKYIFLGICAAFIVPLFLKMIASDLIKKTDNYDNICYLVFGGFCLIASIFSRRFITSVGEKILEEVKEAKKTAKESKQKSDNTQSELTSSNDRIEDVKLAIDLKNIERKPVRTSRENQPLEKLLSIVNSYVAQTTVPDYNERMKIKAELGRKMAEIIIRNNLPKNDLLRDHQKEGMYLALAYTVQLYIDDESLGLLNKLAVLTKQLYIQYVILLGYKALARLDLIRKSEVKEIYSLINKFRTNADRALLRHIDDTISILKIIEPNLDE